MIEIVNGAVRIDGEIVIDQVGRPTGNGGYTYTELAPAHAMWQRQPRLPEGWRAASGRACTDDHEVTVDHSGCGCFGQHATPEQIAQIPAVRRVLCCPLPRGDR